jgi:flagellar biosynthetic protein FliQ
VVFWFIKGGVTQGIMTEQVVIQIGKEALFLILVISGPPVLMGMIVGFLISLFQATTQIQEQTLTFVPKLIAVFVTLALIGHWMIAQLIRFGNSLFTAFPNYIR